MKKTELGLISLREEMLSDVRHIHGSLIVCMHVHTRTVYPFVSTSVRACLCVCAHDWRVVDLLGTASCTIRCLYVVDDWQLIWGPEISVFEREDSRKHVTSKQNWSSLGPISLIQHVCQAGNEDRPGFILMKAAIISWYICFKTCSDSCIFEDVSGHEWTASKHLHQCHL